MLICHAERGSDVSIRPGVSGHVRDGRASADIDASCRGKADPSRYWLSFQYSVSWIKQQPTGAPVRFVYNIRAMLGPIVRSNHLRTIVFEFYSAPAWLREIEREARGNPIAGQFAISDDVCRVGLKYSRGCVFRFLDTCPRKFVYPSSSGRSIVSNETT